MTMTWQGPKIFKTLSYLGGEDAAVLERRARGERTGQERQKEDEAKFGCRARSTTLDEAADNRAISHPGNFNHHDNTLELLHTYSTSYYLLAHKSSTSKILNL